MNRRFTSLSIAALLLASLPSCKPLSIEMSEAVPPTFSFDGGRFAHYKRADFFVVVEVAPENQKLPAYAHSPVEDKIIWWIWPDDYRDGELENLPAITYGTVPAGWHQRVPEGGGPPPPLVEGKVYEAGGPQISVPEAVMRFTIRNGKVVRLPLYQEESDKQQSGED